VSTPAAQALVSSLRASQAGVARGAQVQGKRGQQTEPGKIASAGFAQVLGEQVAKSKPQAEPSAHTGQGFVAPEAPTSLPSAPKQDLPQDLPQSLPLAPTRSLPQSLTHTAPTAQPHSPPRPAANVAEKNVPQSRAQLHLERSEQPQPATLHLPVEKPRIAEYGSLQGNHPAPRVRTEPSMEGEAAPAQATYPIKQPSSPSVAINSKPRLADPRPDKFLTGSRPAKHEPAMDGPAKGEPAKGEPAKGEPAAIQAARIGRAVYPLTGRTEKLVDATITPNREARVPVAARAQVEPSLAQPALTQHVVRHSAPTPKSPTLASPISTDVRPNTAGTATPALPSAIPNTARPSSRPVETPQVTARPAQSPVPVLISTPVLEQVPTQPPVANRVPTKASETVASAPSKAGDSVGHVPARPSNGTAHLPIQASNTAHREQPAAPVAPTAPDTSPRLTTKAHAATIQSTIGNTIEANPPVASPAAPSGDHVQIPTSHAIPLVQVAAGENDSHAPAPALPKGLPGGSPVHIAVPNTVGKSVENPAQSGHTTHLPVRQPIANPSQQHTVDNTVDIAPAPASSPDQAPTGFPTVAEATPAHEQEPVNHPSTTQAPLGAQAPSRSIPRPIPATVEPEASAPQIAGDPAPVNPPETAQPIAAVKASPAGGLGRPPQGHPVVVEEPKLEATLETSTSDGKAPESNATPAETSGENTTRATPHKAATASPEPTGPMPEPGLAHLGVQGAIHAEPLGNKQRPRIEDEKKADDYPSAPTSAPHADHQPAQAAPSVPSEVTPPKPDVAQPLESKATTTASSQTMGTPPTAGQPFLAKEDARPDLRPDSQPAVLLTPDRPTVFVPATTLPTGTSEAGVRESAPSPVAVEAAGLVDRAIQDPGLSVTVMPHSAHVSIAGDTGDLSLHVRVRDGSADVNVSGTMAPLFDSKAPEMRTALAGEGLQLGSFATDQRSGSQDHQGQPEDAPRTSDPHPQPPPRQNNTSTPEVQITANRRIHVTA
jgi:hypothetical protein